jgi:4-amino-4-deoxy-L-arabinose transferase-like glycosyltransferase
VVYRPALVLVARVVLYFAMVLPWFIAVQRQNPTFFREFFLEHNLERFATDRYEHSQPFWYYLVVVVLAMMPWTVVAVRRSGRRHSDLRSRVAAASFRNTAGCPSRPGDAFPEFLVLWALIPIVFFSFSQSKLPGYILPSIPPIAILTGDFLFRRRQQGLNRWLLLGHACSLRSHDGGRADVALVRRAWRSIAPHTGARALRCWPLPALHS